jgi:uncharacterized caspase-like protein
MFPTNDSAEQQPGSRRAELVSLPASYAVDVDRWAIVVGVSKYKYESLNLRYADRDAEEFHKLLLSPTGGNFRPDHVVKLTNHDATTANVTKALRSFLKKPGRDDLVIIYCACHGSPDFDRPGNVYLLTHDTDPNDIAGTALPMREIDLSLRENLLSERVVIFADTCHSAAIGGGIGRRGTVDSTALVNRYLKDVSTARGGVALLTSAEATEVSFEDARWGGGHGVFTHYLLRGMQGEADLNQNGFVTIGELFEYVRAKVQEETEYKQHPSIGTNPYDRNLPLAITFPTTQNLAKFPETNYSVQENFKHEGSGLNLPIPPIRFLNSKMIMIMISVVVVSSSGIWALKGFLLPVFVPPSVDSARPPNICTKSFQSESRDVEKFCNAEIAGFQALIDGKLTKARENFCHARDLYDTAHSVDEICRKVLTPNRLEPFASADASKQQEIQKEILQEIVSNHYLVGIPTDLREEVRSRLNQLQNQN